MKKLMVLIILVLSSNFLFADEIDDWMNRAIEKAKGYPYIELGYKSLDGYSSMYGIKSSLMGGNKFFRFGYPFEKYEISVIISESMISYGDSVFKPGSVGIGIKFYIK